MRINRAFRTLLPILIVIGGIAPVGAMAQHVHGVIELGIVLEDDTIAVSLSAPLSDVVGFEHAPESDEQVSSIQQAAVILADANRMFGLAEAANCEVSDVSVDGPAYVMQHIETEESDADAHDDDHHDEHESERGDHDHHDEHADSGEHDHDDEEQHSEVDATYAWTCGDVSALDSLALHFTGKFASVETIEIQILSPAGARVLTAEGRATSVSLAP